MGMYDAGSSAAGAAVGVGVVVYWIFMLLVAAFSIFCMWRLFEKAGVEGWKAIIPCYNVYTLFEILYGKGILFLCLLVPFLNIYIMIKYSLDLAKCYGKDTGFGIGILLLPIVFIAILAFDGNARYVGTTKAPL